MPRTRKERGVADAFGKVKVKVGYAKIMADTDMGLSTTQPSLAAPWRYGPVLMWDSEHWASTKILMQNPP